MHVSYSTHTLAPHTRPLHSHVSSCAILRLHGEESALDRLRAETAAAAAGEAALIANLRGQVGELQGVLQVG